VWRICRFIKKPSLRLNGQLRRALWYRFISEQEYPTHWETFDEIAAMLIGLKRHLDHDDRKDRG
jgi:hypothetical protein